MTAERHLMADQLPGRTRAEKPGSLALDLPYSTVLVDARALQDPDYRYRGVGQHSTCILTALHLAPWRAKRPRIVALVDASLPVLASEHRSLFDVVLSHPPPRSTDQQIFICLSPLTHDQTWLVSILTDPSIYKICLFYDLIQLLFPERYLSHQLLRLDFLTGLNWLQYFDAFAAISAYSARELANRLKIDRQRIFVSGVAVRSALEPRSEAPIPRAHRAHVVVSGGGDPRKNPECALVAHARLGARGLKTPIHVIGNYPESMRQQLRDVYVAAGGQVLDLHFPIHLADEELRKLYRHAILTIVPSKAEGFSIPIVESNAAGTPAIASDVGAHSELLPDRGDRFDPGDPDELARTLDVIVGNETTWTAVRDRQAELWRAYTLETVGARFLDGVVRRQPSHPAPAVARKTKPRIAIIGPLPPAPSGVADYTYATVKPLARHAQLHMFSDSLGIAPDAAWSSLSPVSAAPLGKSRFEAVVSVLGNSDHHMSAFNYLLDHGGAAIAHDARMINFYRQLLGPERSIMVASREMNESVPLKKVDHWLHNQRELPILFMSEIAQAASPLIVHSAVTQGLIKSIYDKNTVLLPFAQYRGMNMHDLERRRDEARNMFDVDSDEIMICSFGFVSDDKSPDELISALHLLISWGLKTRLVFVGLPHPNTGERLRDFAMELGVSDRVQISARMQSLEDYDAYLLAADIGVQLRHYRLGGLSGALNDCIAVAMPCITNDSLGEAMDAPAFVRRIPDEISPLLLAEAVLNIIGSGDHRQRPTGIAQAFADKHSPERYCQELMSALGFTISSREYLDQ